MLKAPHGFFGLSVSTRGDSDLIFRFCLQAAKALHMLARICRFVQATKKQTQMFNARGLSPFARSAWPCR